MYQDDFSKYKSRISPVLLRKVLRSVALQVGGKFVCRQVDDQLHSSVIKEGLRHAVRTSLKNFGRFEYVDKEADDAVRLVDVVPLYALSDL